MAKEKYEYYRHLKMSSYHEYFCHVGDPVKISHAFYLLLKATGFRVTKVKKGTPLNEVMVQAVIASGAHPNSWRVEKARETGHDRS